MIKMASASNRIDQDDLIYNPKIYSFSPDMLQEFLFNLATINNELTQNRSKFCVKFLLYFCMKSILKKHHLKNIGII
jgi:hypothetical protein